MKKTLEIIIVSYNCVKWLQKTLDSLSKFYLNVSKYDIKVTVVDNASSDSTVETLKNSYPFVNLIISDKNLGFSAGNNLALRKSEADFIMLLNSDMEFIENKSNIDSLLDYMTDNNRIGIISPKLLLTNGQIDMACHRGEPGIFDAFCYFAGFEKIFSKSKFFSYYHMLHKNLNEIHCVDAVSGACMVMRNGDLKKIGYFDEQFFMYSEDMDLCRRFRECGYDIAYYPFVSIIHHKYKSGLNSSDKKTKKKISDCFYDSLILYYDKYYNRKLYYKSVRPLLKRFISFKKR